LSWAAFVSLDIDNLYGMISTSTQSLMTKCSWLANKWTLYWLS